MLTELQFVAITAFLIWGLVSSVCGLLTPSAPEPVLVWREHRPDGWDGWREVHFGLTGADRRAVEQAHATELTESDRAGLTEAVLQQTRRDDSDAVQFAVVHRSLEGIHTAPAVVCVCAPVAIRQGEEVAAVGTA
ncbi:hypothetical protein O6P37_07110 [Mycobacterium sp. CPCC 205372]|uniref:Uncharacterized protein n=1 Tax=Mycobacterium hippophais TaxID=3016340 RepID=A0ABT4PPY7_9MYCO|nr:hypothetical protein [Mycobacterium hippophais]MCZ8378625.1 hypothetical protein [Mycobacterium hippophais]